MQFSSAEQLVEANLWLDLNSLMSAVRRGGAACTKVNVLCNADETFIITSA